MTVVLESDGLVVHHGDARDVLRSLPANSVHCVVTSPPYWSLRDYGIPSTVWGGEDHEHEWVTPMTRTAGGVDLGKNRWQHQENGRGEDQPGERRQRLEEPDRIDGHPEIPAGVFCSCGAWYGALGLEPTPDLYLEHTVELFREVRRVLRKDGTCWINIGDTYASHDPGDRRGGEFLSPDGVQYDKGRRQGPAVRNRSGSYGPAFGLKPKDRVMIPAQVAIALRSDGWWLRDEIVWAKPNSMPSSVEDRTTPSHEMIYLLSKSARYFYDAEAIRERATSGASDLRKMAEAKPRIAGSASGPYADHAALGRLRAVGGAPAARERNVGGRDDGFTRMPGGEADWAENGRAGRNKRSVWTIATQPYPEAHFATFPTKLVEPMILAGTSAKGVCPDCGAPWVRVTEIEYVPSPVHGAASVTGRRRDVRNGKTSNEQGGGGMPRVNKAVETTGWRPNCRHGGHADDLEVIRTPIGEGQGSEYHRDTHGGSGTGRRGLDRRRKLVECTRSMYRWEQRAIAEQLRQSEHRDEMAESAGPAFEHYVRTDRSGARAVPPDLLNAWLDAGWVTWPERDEPQPTAPVPATVLDPFAGSGTTGLVAGELGRRAVLIDLNTDYLRQAIVRATRGLVDPGGHEVPDDSLWAMEAIG